MTDDFLAFDVQATQEKFGNRKFIVYVVALDSVSGVSHRSEVGMVEEIGNMYKPVLYTEPMTQFAGVSKKKTAIEMVINEYKKNIQEKLDKLQN